MENNRIQTCQLRTLKPLTNTAADYVNPFDAVIERKFQEFNPFTEV